METFLLENQADQLFAELSPETQLRWSKWRLTFRDAGTEQTLFLLLWFRVRDRLLAPWPASNCDPKV